jgi:hypothetical protein
MIALEDAAKAKATVLAVLARRGIDDDFTVKLRSPTKGEWLALYRSGSQFKSGTIFWLNAKHALDQRELVLTLLHEYAHVIWELARESSAPAMTRLFEDLNDTFMDDEEEFAESFARAAVSAHEAPWLTRVCAAYMGYLRGSDDAG